MIQIKQLTKTFRNTKGLDNVNAEIGSGEMVALIGSSGSGKSTLMRHISGLMCCDPGTSGQIEVLNHVMQRDGRLSRNARKVRTEVGVIFQQFNLVDRLSVMTNVLMGALGRVPTWRAVSNLFPPAERRLALESLARVGMADKAWQRASTLSGGQQQRVAIARALTQRARVLLADEPIASLDPESSRVVMDILADVHRQDKMTIVVSLHQVEYAIRYCPRTIALRRGRVVYDGPSHALTPSFLKDIYGAETEELFSPAVEGAARSQKALHSKSAAAPAAA
ncbi:phosphonate ABC transporter ATP-binding protein [Desulfomicrobium salsuginis]